MKNKMVNVITIAAFLTLSFPAGAQFATVNFGKATTCMGTGICNPIAKNKTTTDARSIVLFALSGNSLTMSFNADAIVKAGQAPGGVSTFSGSTYTFNGAYTFTVADSVLTGIPSGTTIPDQAVGQIIRIGTNPIISIVVTVNPSQSTNPAHGHKKHDKPNEKYSR